MRIGRAIVREPDLFLFDEPLSNLDAGMRVQMRQEFAELHKRLGVSTLYVTHDQAEAMALADRIVLMRDGRIEQQGSPQDLYRHPQTLFAAQFLRPSDDEYRYCVTRFYDNGRRLSFL